METETAVAFAFVKKVFDDLNRRDYARASQYFADEVTLTGAEFLVLKGREALIKHFRQSDAALADSSLKIVDILTGKAKVGVEFVLTWGREEVSFHPRASRLRSLSSGP